MSAQPAPTNTIGIVLGELITASGIVREEILNEAELVSEQSTLPVGRVLVMGGHLGEGDLTSALRAAQMVREGKLTRRQATQALREAYNQCIPLEEIVDELLEYVPATRLGQLLASAQIVPITTLCKLEPRSGQHTLGQMLTTYGIISVTLLGHALDLLTLIRNSKISIAQAAEALRICCISSMPPEEALQRVVGENVFDKRQAKLGSLLIASGICNEGEILLAAEFGAEQNRPIGEVLFELGKIDSLILQATLTVQSMLAAGTLCEAQSIEVLRQVQAKHLPVEELIQDLRELKRRVVALLKSAVIISEKDINRAVELCPAHANDVARALVSSEIVDMQTIKNAVRCLAIMRNDGIKEEIAAAAMRHSKRTGMPIELAIKAVTALEKPITTISALGMKIIAESAEHFDPQPHFASGCA